MKKLILLFAILAQTAWGQEYEVTGVRFNMLSLRQTDTPPNVYVSIGYRIVNGSSSKSFILAVQELDNDKYPKNVRDTINGWFTHSRYGYYYVENGFPVFNRYSAYYSADAYLEPCDAVISFDDEGRVVNFDDIMTLDSITPNGNELWYRTKPFRDIGERGSLRRLFRISTPTFTRPDCDDVRID